MRGSEPDASRPRFARAGAYPIVNGYDVKNQLARPLQLLVLIGLVALVVGFANPGTAWAQVPGPVVTFNPGSTMTVTDDGLKPTPTTTGISALPAFPWVPARTENSNGATQDGQKDHSRPFPLAASL